MIQFTVKQLFSYKVHNNGMVFIDEVYFTQSMLTKIFESDENRKFDLLSANSIVSLRLTPSESI